MRARRLLALLCAAACSSPDAPAPVPVPSDIVSRPAPTPAVRGEPVDEVPAPAKPPLAREREKMRATPPADDGRRFSIEGRVVSDLDEPVTIRISNVTQWGSGEAVQQFETTVAPGSPFRFEGLRPRTYSGRAQSASSAYAAMPRIDLSADVTGVEVHVRRACRVVGHVTLGAGIDRDDCRIDWGRDHEATDAGPVPADGRFTIRRLEPGPVTITVGHWPDRNGPRSRLRGLARVEVSLVPGDNAVEVVVDPSTLRAE